jgi:hypothetical protein
MGLWRLRSGRTRSCDAASTFRNAGTALISSHTPVRTGHAPCRMPLSRSVERHLPDPVQESMPQKVFARRQEAPVQWRNDQVGGGRGRGAEHNSDEAKQDGAAPYPTTCRRRAKDHGSIALLAAVDTGRSATLTLDYGARVQPPFVRGAISDLVIPKPKRLHVLTALNGWSEKLRRSAHRNFNGSFSGGGGATSLRFHQPPPSATNRAAVSAYCVARAPAEVISAER